METLHALNLHMLSTSCGSLDTSISTGTNWRCSLASGPKPGRPCHNILSQKRNLFFNKHSCSRAQRSRQFPSYHASVDSPRPAAKSNDYNFGSHEETILLKKRGAEVVPDLRSKCIFLVGMMGSGKSTIGKVLADALGYHFVDSDRVIEEAAGGMSVAEFFKQQNEEAFRDAETKALEQLSCKTRLVVATGGGIVVRPENWKYMKCGLSVWLDVPLESLAERVVAAGTHSRPLIGGEGETRGTSAYTQALIKMSTIFENRQACYANADAKVSVQKVATYLGYPPRDISPTVIAMQALEEIHQLLWHRKQNENDLDASSKVII